MPGKICKACITNALMSGLGCLIPHLSHATDRQTDRKLSDDTGTNRTGPTFTNDSLFFSSILGF